jgi:hypothetical protein
VKFSPDAHSLGCGILHVAAGNGAILKSNYQVRFVSTFFGVTKMKTFQATWEDEENNRRVELVVNHQLDATRVNISDVTPTRVTFLCPTSGSPLRSIGIWTDGGRRVMNRQIEAAGRLASLPQEIAAGQLVEIKHPAPRVTAQPTPVLQA